MLCCAIFRPSAKSVGRLSSALRDAHPEVNWRAIIGLRNVLVHDYLGMNLERVWAIVEHDVPDLKRQVEVLHQAFPDSPSSGTWSVGLDEHEHSPQRQSSLTTA